MSAAGCQWDTFAEGGVTVTTMDAAAARRQHPKVALAVVFAAGAGLWLEGTPDGFGNLNLNWRSGFTLQEATNVIGPWTDIGAATPPYSVPILKIGNKFYRVKPASF